MKFFWLPVLLLIVGLNCTSSKEFTGFSYDPPDVTNTKDREVKPQYRRIIGTGQPVVWVSNNFEGARLSNFYAVNDSTFEAFIEPENFPINNSPWYAFKIWSDTVRTISLRLNYKDARHRYIPKIKIDEKFTPIDIEQAIYDSVGKTLEFKLKVDPKPKLVSAQIITDNEFFDKWLSKITKKPFVNIEQIGISNLGNSIKEISINEVLNDKEAGVLVIMSRQHPPEVSGFLASLFFIEELSAESELAENFRSEFKVRMFPLINPDGVLNGHWRHNAAGVDLNRDWENFNQPETRAVRDALLPILKTPKRKVFYGIDFHSTNENIFYPIEESVKTYPDNFTQKWISFIESDNSDIEFATEEFDTSSPIFKNWIFRTFGADAVTFEVYDELDIKTIEKISRSAAQSLMRLLLGEKSKTRFNKN